MSEGITKKKEKKKRKGNRSTDSNFHFQLFGQTDFFVVAAYGVSDAELP